LCFEKKENSSSSEQILICIWYIGRKKNGIMAEICRRTNSIKIAQKEREIEIKENLMNRFKRMMMMMTDFLLESICFTKKINPNTLNEIESVDEGFVG
jgi:hypothetical protein